MFLLLGVVSAFCPLHSDVVPTTQFVMCLLFKSILLLLLQDCASSDYSASESDNRSPPYFSQSCAAAPGIGVRPPPLSRTSSDSVATRMAHASISTTHGCNAPYPGSSRPLNCSMPSPLATHSVQHSASSPPPLLPSAAQVSPPVWQRAASVPYTLYGQ